MRLKMGVKKTVEESDSMLERFRVQNTDYTQKEFAEACGIPHRTYQDWISGATRARPEPKQVKAIIKVLGIGIDELPDDFGPVHAKSAGETLPVE
jgi:putative transcriptional regulator